ncbi:M20/M25/M40 family metallo-hydrolase [Occallatibacter riparius]|uniref:Carboxypeptidase Q n=1 Tax=Occallatibacter riparius TaxID=1002689 RepID=A0A9J7BS32_9BACT|nr:M20/M25/M40 family metallo-hydrolase [Occallatibacter riparius]UWZ85383.1 M20/M25/M40 family metallo-hydrolase [Occallatibacter riparius]
MRVRAVIGWVGVGMGVALAPIGVRSQGAVGASQVDAATRQAVVKLGGQLMMAGKAYDYDRQLADELGPRLTGSDNYIKAADWAVGEFKRLGLTNVHKDEWEITNTWEPEEWATARITAPREMRLHLESDGWSPSTPKGGVKGRVFYLKALTEEAIKTGAPDIKDAIVLLDRDSMEGPLLWGKSLDLVDMMAKEGAKAFLLGVGAQDNVPVMFGLTGNNGAVAPVPVANVGKEDTLLLRRMLEKGPVQVEFSFKNKVRDHVKVPNVVADIPGTDGSGEYVLIGGHLDSWQLGTGAQDNGTGAASVMAVAEAVKASGIQPKRTMRFALFGGEEEGLLGSIHYAQMHTAELAKCAGVFITDTGASAPTGWYVYGRDDERKMLEALKPQLSALDAAGISDDGRFTFATDHGPFLVQGVPAFVLWTPFEEYHKIHHKPSDTFDKVNQRDLNLGTAVVGITALTVADSAQPLKHYSQAEMEEQLKKIKEYDEYKDMVDHKML